MKRVSPFILCTGIFWLIIQTTSLCTEPKVAFSHERGFYYASFELTLDAGSDACHILYTLDGSDPRYHVNSIESASPCVLPINPYISEGRAISPGVVVRACAICGNDTSEVETHSFIFLSEVKFQPDVSPEVVPFWPGERYISNNFPPTLIDWMRSDFQLVDLAADPEVIYRDEYYTAFEPALFDIPTLSLVTDPENLWSETSGIYRNATWSGREWERPGSIELIDPVNDGFQVNTGIRIRGGWSCRGDFGKHAFRLFFRKEYGNAKLNYPLFGEEGADEFDKIDLRCDANNSWSMPGGNPNADFVHELFARDIQGAMEQPFTRSMYYHLFVNGMYWGLYQTQERPEASYAETYLGGEKEDYDVVKASGPSYDYPPYTLEATDGDLNSSYEFWQIAKEGFTPENYNKVKGLNPDGTRNPAYKIYLDEDNLIDYMIIIFFSSNYDGPAELGNGSRINNFFAIFDRENPDGFKYMLHDAETTFGHYSNDNVHSITTVGEEFSGFNPRWLHQKLTENAEYRQKFADRAYNYLSNGGVLTPEKNIERFTTRVEQCEEAIIGESARWGDGYSDGGYPYTRESTWRPVIRNFYENYFPQRTDVVIDQFVSVGWMNSLLPPAFDESDFEIDDESGIMLDDETFKLINLNAAGTIYYTLNNSDPRRTGGDVSPEAMIYSGEITISQTAFLKARIKDGDDWSPLTERVILTNPGMGLLISEICYHPKEHIIDTDTLEDKQLEFIEIKNHYTDELDLSGYYLTGGIRYAFPLNTLLEADSLLVISSDSISFKKLYGFEPFGQFDGNLSNTGEEVKLRNACGVRRAEVEFNNDGVWFEAADGIGYTLVFTDYDQPQSFTVKENWRISTNWLGSPGKDDPAPIDIPLEFTEVLANSDFPQTDAIEIHNRSTGEINIGGWYLSDTKELPAKWQIPIGAVVPAGGYKVFYEGHYVGETMQYNADEFGSAFSLSSAGEDIFLYSSDGSGIPQHFACMFESGATNNSTSFGNYINAVGELNSVQLDTFTFGQANATFKPSPLIFKTIMYHPAGNNFEFLVLKNRSDSVLHLYDESNPTITWKVDGIDFDFPATISVDPGDSVYLVEKSITSEAFRQSMNIDPGTGVFNYSGKLKNSTDRISIENPIAIEGDTANPYAWVRLETVEYNDESPWPALADGDGYALQRKNENAFANDYSNWTTSYCTLPDAHAGTDKRVRINTSMQLNGSQSSDPAGNPLSYQWNIITKPAGSNSILSDASLMMPQITPDRLGNYQFSLTVSNGENESTPAYISIFAYENRPPVALFPLSTIRVDVNETAVLNGSLCYDPDYEELSYEWDLYEQPEGSTATIQSPSSKMASLIPDVEGRYDINVTVSDGEFSSVNHCIVMARQASGIPGTSITSDILVYPNPTNNRVEINMEPVNSRTITITITDLEGRTIFSEDYSGMTGGLNHFSIGMNELNVRGGMYMLKIQSDETVVTRKILYTK